MFNLIFRCIIGAIIGAVLGILIARANMILGRLQFNWRVKRAFKNGEL